MRTTVFLVTFALMLPSPGLLADVGHGPAVPPDEAASRSDGEDAYGTPGDRHRATRTIEIEASDDMRYTPATIAIAQGETVRIVVNNTGQVPHELVLGSLAEAKEHAEMMRTHPGMAHDEPNQVMIEPGRTGELVWHFSHAGKFDFACTIPGHLEAGMKGIVIVNRKSSDSRVSAARS